MKPHSQVYTQMNFKFMNIYIHNRYTERERERERERDHTHASAEAKKQMPQEPEKPIS
jgi:hypothetical protein